jgi:hypothetical protein
MRVAAAPAPAPAPTPAAAALAAAGALSPAAAADAPSPAAGIAALQGKIVKLETQIEVDENYPTAPRDDPTLLAKRGHLSANVTLLAALVQQQQQQAVAASGAGADHCSLRAEASVCLRLLRSLVCCSRSTLRLLLCDPRVFAAASSSSGAYTPHTPQRRDNCARRGCGVMSSGRVGEE